MVARAGFCDHYQLERLLEDDLPKSVASDVTRHVESCDACRRHLETLAADDSWWQEARCFLGAEEGPSDVVATGATISLNHLASEIDTTPDELMLDLLDKSDNPAMLGRIGDYEVLEVIGRGGMGIVLKAYDGELNRYVAIKVLLPHFASSAAARKRFGREAQAAAAIVHQHVVAIHAVDVSGKLPYLVMPFVACESLQERIEREGPLDLKDVLRIGRQAADGLAAAHAQGLVHRDVKPANILLEKSVDRVLLTDFGLARAIDDATVTRSGVIAGTPQYMSPEQAKGEAIDHRTDLFSLGSVLYTISTGRPPFRAETTMGTLRRICEADPRSPQEIDPDVPKWLCKVIEQLLAKDPEQRLSSAADVASLLESCLAYVQHPTSVELPHSLAESPRSIHAWLASAAFSIAALAALILVMVWGFSNRSATQPFDGQASDLEWSDPVISELTEIESEIQRLEIDSLELLPREFKP